MPLAPSGWAQAAARALLDWGTATWPEQPPRSLAALATRVDQGAEAIQELETSLYSAASRDWSGQPLWQAFMDGLQSRVKKSSPGQSATSAPPLYPDWNRKAG